MNDSMNDTTDRTGMGYWVLTGRMFLEALRRAHAGENPDDIFHELYEQTELMSQG